jgi:hypothetical protein
MCKINRRAANFSSRAQFASVRVIDREIGESLV